MLEVLTLCLFKRMLCCVGSQGHEFLSGSACSVLCVSFWCDGILCQLILESKSIVLAVCFFNTFYQRTLYFKSSYDDQSW